MLLKPLRWPYPNISMIPNSLIAILDSPFPIVGGKIDCDIDK